jgi:hypothetical protein
VPLSFPEPGASVQPHLDLLGTTWIWAPSNGSVDSFSAIGWYDDPSNFNTCMAQVEVERQVYKNVSIDRGRADVWTTHCSPVFSLDFKIDRIGHFLVREIPEPGHPTRIVEIDIKPGSDTNPIEPFSRGFIAVALLASDRFDVADADLTTLAFGPDGATPAFDLADPLIYWLSHRDLNRDGKKDLLSSYRIEETGIGFGDTEACLAGETLDGILFEGCDAVTTVVLPWGCGLGVELPLLLWPLMWLWRRRRS